MSCLSWLLLATASALAADPIPGIGPSGEIGKLHTGFKFTEGPAADAEGNLYFTDIPQHRIHISATSGKLTTFLEESQGTNGLMFDGTGRLVACQGKAHRVIAIDPATKRIEVVADSFAGKPLTVVPNDLVIDQSGGVYFTDPDARAVFYVGAEGTVRRILQGLPRPNGVLLTPDEKTFVVLPSASGDVMTYPIEAPGKIGEGKVFFRLPANPQQPGRPGGDGLTVDTNGNFYFTRPSLKQVIVVSPQGKQLGSIQLPEDPANCAFGGKDRKTLFVTAQTSLYAIPMEARGHVFPGKLPPKGRLQSTTASAAPLPEAWDYGPSMKKVAAKFRGQEGVVLHVGGSMTIANPYGTWARTGKGKTPDDEAILKWMHCEARDKTDGWWLCRTELEHYRAYTAESGLKSAMLLAGGKRGLPTLEKMLDDFQPRMVTIECGIYDVEDGVSLEEYRANMAKALDLILARGAIPILNTIPPFKAQLARTKEFNEALRSLCKERGAPLLDLEKEILTRRPDDWFGPLMDRIHLTATNGGGNPSAEPTAENLGKSGYLLRSYLTVKKIAEIKARVID